jgi:hypothetical protein
MDGAVIVPLDAVDNRRHETGVSSVDTILE